MKIRYTLLAILLIIFAVSCNDDNGSGPETQLPDHSTVYVTNEGNFGDANGSITTYEAEKDTVIQKAFEAANGRPLAGTLQSTSVFDDKLYLSLNDADKIEIVDPKTLTSLATIPITTDITALQVVDEQTAYAANLYNSVATDSVSIIDLANTRETDQRIAVGDQPRDIVKVDNLVYVANTGFSGSGKTVSVINSETNNVTKTLDVGIAPTKLVLDGSNNIWVVCNGLIAYNDNFERVPENDVSGSIYIIDGENAVIRDSIKVDGHPRDLVLDENNGLGYLLDSGVKTINLNTKQVVQTLFADSQINAIFYSDKEEVLYAGKLPAVDPYSQPGNVIRYNLNGAAVDSFKAGIAPNGFYSVKSQ